jgi:hypothetical protein
MILKHSGDEGMCLTGKFWVVPNVHIPYKEYIREKVVKHGLKGTPMDYQ